MNRSARAHRSTKIPNVKLRPAQRESDIASSPLSSSAASKQQQNRLAKRRDQLIDDRQDAAHFRQLRDQGHDHGAHLDADFIGTSARPFKGAIISITGIGDVKAALTQYARELGARVEGNLTEDVTHLIADRPGSEKYRYALELGMHIVSPNWILDARDAWLQGKDIDAQELEEKHLLPPLSNTTVCFSAVGGAERRKLVALAKQLRATVSDELRFDGSITHLVSATADPNASSSVHHLLRFLDRSRHGRNGTREQAASRILAVRPEWLQDCQKAGGCLSEQVYSIFATLPDQKGREALIEKARFKIPSPFLHVEEQVVLPFQGPFVASSRSKLRLIDNDNSRGAGDQDEADEDEKPITLGSRQKAAAAGEKSFDNILSQLRGNQPSSSTGKAATAATTALAPASASASASASTLAPSSTATTSAPYNPHRNSLLGMSRASSFSPAPPPSTSTATTLPMRKASTSHLTFTSKSVVLPHSSPLISTQSTTESSTHGIFLRKSFKIALHDPQRKRVLEQVLKDNCASIIPVEHKAMSHYTVVEPKISPAALDALFGDGAQPVLHFWIEYCLYHEMFMEPREYFAGLPAQVPQPIPDGNKLRLLLLGFDADSPELYHAQKVVGELGGSIAKQMKGEALTHVVCATQESFEGKRAQKARNAGVPVVALEFLMRARETGCLIPPPQPATVIERSSSTMTTSSSSSTSTGLTNNSILTNEQQVDEPALPLSGCTISRSKVLASQSVMLERKVLQLGGCWQAQPNESTTHLLHRGNGAPREYKELGSSTFLVHPNWLEKCLEQNIRVDESLFPSSMDPARSLLTVLSNSDGSAQGNFLSQASQRGSGSQQQTQTQAELVAAAKPWHRSISVDAARYADNETSRTETERFARGRSEEIEVAPQFGDADLEGLEDVDFDDADITLNEDVRARPNPNVEEVAPSSQTLFEGEDDSPLPNICGVVKKASPQPPASPTPLLKSTKDLTSADEVMQLLRTRTLASSGRKKNRLPPRARKSRCDERINRSNSNDMLPPEKVLEAQAARDAQRAEEAAAQGFSSGIDKDVALQPGASQSFDASVKIVYEDPAARRERMKLLKILEAQPVQVREDENGKQQETETEQEQMQSMDGAEEGAAESKKRGAGDTFGAGRPARHYWETRDGQSPTKRPVVRRQPLARR